MSIDENKRLVRRFTQVWTPGNLGLLDELAAPDIVLSYPALPEPVRGIENLRQFLTMFHAAFPDARYAAEEEVAEADKVVVRWRLSGTHRGDLLGIPPTGKSVAWGGIAIFTVANGRVVSERGEEDALGLMQQLGVIPAEEQAPTGA